MGFYEERIVPHLVDVALGTAPFEKLRARVAAPLDGEVLEVGFGSGRNVRHYPDAVTKVYAVDPSGEGRRMSEKRVAETSVPVEFVGLDGQHLPLDDASVDRVLVTWSLCTIPDPALALREMRRVLRPGGTVHFIEHGRSDDPKVRRWQDRLTPMQRRIAGGCHLDRPIAQLIEDAGFTLADLTRYEFGRPKVLTTTYEGIAAR